MHPFTWLALWLWYSVSALFVPLPVLVGWSMVPVVMMMMWAAARWRIKIVMVFMIPMGIGLWLVHSHWLQSLFSHSDNISFAVPMFAIVLWLRLFVFFAAAQLWLQKVPTQQFVAALFSSRLPVGMAYLCAGPLLLKEQLKQQLAAIKEAQSARGVSFDGFLVQRLKTIVPLLSPLLMQSLNDLTTRSSALDARAFRRYPHRTVLKPISEYRWEPFLRVVLLCCLLVEGGAFWLYHSISIG